jgi:hypothetical protein
MRLPTIVALAQPRVAKSTQPERFLRQVRDTVTRSRAGEEIATAAWTMRDPVALAAEIEALAGLRRLAAAGHRITCECDVCRVQHHTAAEARRNGR